MSKPFPFVCKPSYLEEGLRDRYIFLDLRVQRKRKKGRDGSGFTGSWLVNKLLDKGHVVQTILRNLVDDERKTGLLKSFAGANSRLFLFEADIYKPESFVAAIQGCEFVFLVATPLQHNSHSAKKVYRSILPSLFVNSSALYSKS
ncbi:vestitone reductase-like [Dioscorea cayenensis subsp. rotundata]|uniref:Vestitone reductase-like n=1 Tax=Dioscorea cayennensis subsp. rotundata TaxID=55577 RepID=A0AB40CZQ9_DIOCR|nr:vestitone reductase-like [Dioscorea cayenensis subsp. rotundata]